MRLREANVRVDVIARQLGRHGSTIYRELKRNWWHDAEVPQAEGTWPVTAQSLAERRRRGRRKLLRHSRLQAAVVDRPSAGVTVPATVLALQGREIDVGQIGALFST